MFRTTVKIIKDAGTIAREISPNYYNAQFLPSGWILCMKYDSLIAVNPKTKHEEHIASVPKVDIGYCDWNETVAGSLSYSVYDSTIIVDITEPTSYQGYRGRDIQRTFKLSDPGIYDPVVEYTTSIQKDSKSIVAADDIATKMETAAPESELTQIKQQLAKALAEKNELARKNTELEEQISHFSTRTPGR